MSNLSENEVPELPQPEEIIRNDNNEPPPQPPLPRKSIRNLIGFWLLGLCNNYGYVIMLSAAHDLLHSDFHSDDSSKSSLHNETNSTETRCNSISTGAILLADILPTLLIKIAAPFITINIHYKVSVAVILSSLSFIITSLSVGNWMTFIGVICASLSSGLGEISFLSYTSFFDRNVVSTWSSGTGGAGVVGALSYAVLAFMMGPRKALLLMLIVPFTMCISFWILIEHPSWSQIRCSSNLCGAELQPIVSENVNLASDAPQQTSRSYSFQEKVALIKPLLKYMVPLGVVYFAEYFINQGLMELLYFPNSLNLSQADLYRWYQVDYQVGVLISRSSVNFFQINKLWILPILQVINLIFLLLEVCFAFIPSMWLILFIILYEGLLGGGAYVNTFYKISFEIPPADREFSMGIACLADSMGIALAGIVSLPVHDALCKIISSRPL